MARYGHIPDDWADGTIDFGGPERGSARSGIDHWFITNADAATIAEYVAARPSLSVPLDSVEPAPLRFIGGGMPRGTPERG